MRAVTIHDGELREVPDRLSWVEAGGTPEVFTTAHDAVFTQPSPVAADATAGSVDGYSGPMHNRYKLPFLLMCIPISAAIAVWGAVAGQWILFGLGVLCAVWVLPPIWVIVTKRGNPWWMRSPLDPPAPDDEEQR